MTMIHPAQVLTQSSLTRDTTNNMKLFKIFKKKSPTPASNHQASNLVCNIHWAEVQRELGQEVIKEKRNIVNYNTNHHVSAYKSSGWNSCDEENYSSGGNSWSSVSLSSSNKTTSADQFQEENFSRYKDRI